MHTLSEPTKITSSVVTRIVKGHSLFSQKNAQTKLTISSIGDLSEEKANAKADKKI
jgi:hypothetical protein